MDSEICKEVLKNEDLFLSTNSFIPQNKELKETFHYNKCQKSFIQNNSLEFHYLIDTPKKSFICKFCQMGFRDKSSFIEHGYQHSGELPFICNFCKRSFRSKRALHDHQAECHLSFAMNAEVGCKTVLKVNEVVSSNNKNSCTSHELLSKKTEKTFCAKFQDVTEKQFVKLGIDIAETLVTNDMSKLKFCYKSTVEEQKNNADRSETCKLCKETFSCKIDLINHQTTCHVDFTDNSKLACSEDLKTNEKVFLVIKNFAEPGEMPQKYFTCNLCEKSFTRKDSLSRHYLSHMPEKFSCDICHVEFKDEANLAIHNSIHTGLSPLTCNLCQKEFVWEHTLAFHKSIHHAEFKPYVCNICKKGFEIKYNLNRHHLQVHSSEKPFICNVCSKSFSRKSDLNRHGSIHTKNMCIVEELLPVKLENNENFPENIEKQTLKMNTGTVETLVSNDTSQFELLDESSSVHTKNTCTLEELLPENLEDNFQQNVEKQNQEMNIDIPKTLVSNDTSQLGLRNESSLEEKKSYADKSCKISQLVCTEEIKNNEVFLQNQNSSEPKDKILKVFTCNVCDKSYTRKDNLYNHYFCHIPEKFICDVCSAEFKNESLLAMHNYTHTGSYPYVCNFCQKAFLWKHTLDFHKAMHHTELKPFVCNICRKSFDTKYGLTRHLQVHSAEKQFTCNICRKSFDTKYGLTRHLQVHSTEKPFTCEVCSKNFSRKSGLERHSFIHINSRQFICNLCGLTFNKETSLIRHVTTHTGEKPYNCELCQQSFLSKVTLNDHVRIHTGEKPFKCDECQKCFSSRSGFNEHKITHANERNFACDQCDKSYNRKSQLVCHKRIHTGERPYVCEVCSKSFMYKSKLNIHVRIHTGEKPYVCDRCQKAFRDRNNLDRHCKKLKKCKKCV